MRKLLVIMILWIGFALGQNTNYNPVEIQGYICFSPDEAFSIVQKLEKLELLKNKMVHYKNLEWSIDEMLSKQKKGRVKVFFNGVAVGGGSVLLAGAVLLLRGTIINLRHIQVLRFP